MERKNKSPVNHWNWYNSEEMVRVNQIPNPAQRIKS